MVAVSYKDLLSWYLITLKLRETIESGIQRPSKDNAKDPKEADHNWIVSIREKLEKAHQDDAKSSWGKINMYRIPHYLRQDDKAYVPQTVSIGPYHHGKKWLRQMDRHKWRSLHRVSERTKQDIKVYLDAMKEMEERARSCYEGSVVLATNEFVEMLVLDGCFVLELFQGEVDGFEKLGYDRNDPVFSMPGFMHSIKGDMIKLENQLPLFVLDRLLGIQLRNPHQKGEAAQLALTFLTLMPTNDPSGPLRFDPLYYLNGLHCLDVFRRSILQKWKRRSNVNPIAGQPIRIELIHCATELKAAGIKFKKRKADRFWDIEFNKGVLWIPCLFIHDGTKSLFRNLIAFEQCHLDCGNDITSYIRFMDSLLNSPDDVAYLHDCEIVNHWLGDDAEVAQLFNSMCQDVFFDINKSYLSKLYEDVNTYYSKPWNRWRATLNDRYFNNPWAIISLAAAAILLLLTFGQTFYGVYAYYNPL